MSNNMLKINTELLTEVSMPQLAWFNKHLRENNLNKVNPLIGLIECGRLLKLANPPRNINGMLCFAIILLIWRRLYHESLTSNKTCRVTSFCVYRDHYPENKYAIKFEMNIESAQTAQIFAIEIADEFIDHEYAGEKIVEVIELVTSIDKAAAIILQDIFNILVEQHNLSTISKKLNLLWLYSFHSVLSNWKSASQTVGPLRVTAGSWSNLFRLTTQDNTYPDLTLGPEILIRQILLS